MFMKHFSPLMVFLPQKKVQSYTKCLYWRKGITRMKIYETGSTVNQVICTLICNCLLNIRILAKVALQIFCSQECFCTNWQLEKGHNPWTRRSAVRGKNVRVCLFFIYMPHNCNISRFLLWRILSFQAVKKSYRWTDSPKPICPFNFSEVRDWEPAQRNIWIWRNHYVSWPLVN